MDNQIDAVKDIVARHIQFLLDELSSYSVLVGGSGKISGGVSTYDPKKVNGLVFYRPHGDPEEENLEAAITVIQQQSGSVKLVADICWSDGEIVSDIAEHDVRYSSLGQLLSEVNQFGQSARMEILRQMTALMDPSCPPKYVER